MKTEDDTFRVLSRMPYNQDLFNKIFDEIRKVKRALGSEKWTEKHKELLADILPAQTGWQLYEIEKQISRPENKSPVEILFIIRTKWILK